jgi:hypothetical protein
LLTIPLFLIYRKFFGIKLTWKLSLVFWVVMSLSGFITEKIFTVLKILPKHHSLMSHAPHLGNNVTSWLNLIALCVGLAIIWLYQGRDTSESSPYSIDPICGMQVEKASATSTLERDGRQFYFCAPGCMESFIDT